MVCCWNAHHHIYWLFKHCTSSHANKPVLLWCAHSLFCVFCSDIERYAVLYAFSVLKEYAHQGLGSKIMEKCLDVARECKCDLVFGDFTSFYSQRISRKFGFEVIYEIAFDGNYLNYEELPEDMRKIHKVMSHSVKRIQRSNWSYSAS